MSGRKTCVARVLACLVISVASYPINADELELGGAASSNRLAPIVDARSNRVAQAPQLNPLPPPATQPPSAGGSVAPLLPRPIEPRPDQGPNNQFQLESPQLGQQPVTTSPPPTGPNPSVQPSPIAPQQTAPQLPDLSQLAQGPTPPSGAGTNSFGSDLLSLFSSPNVIGDFFDGSLRQIHVTDTVSHQFYAMGTPVTPPGVDGGAGALILFERNGTGPPNDITNIPGTGIDASGDVFADTFEIAEPIPPTEVPTSPGPTYTYDGGTAIYTPSATLTNQVEQAEDGQFTNGQAQPWLLSYSYSDSRLVDFALSGGGAAVRRVKIGENNSPVPRNRVYLDYKFFNDVVAGIGDVSRFAPGIERTLISELASIDVRFPVAATMSTTQRFGGTAVDNVEFGNIAVIFKRVLTYTDDSLISAGFATIFPTGKDARLNHADGTPILEIENSSVHIAPYVAGLWQPSEKYFLQSFFQVDVDTQGNQVRGDFSSPDLPELGVLQDATMLFADVSMGYWLLDRSACGGCIQRVAGMAELHYSATVQDADFVSGRGITITDRSNRINVLTGTAGLHLELAGAKHLTAAMSFPLRDGEDRLFDFEVGVLFNAYF